MDKKGQAAFEYLTTYGWVFLVIMIGIGTLAYFGYLSPDNFIPERCWFGTQLICEDYTLDRTSTTQSTLKFKVRNNLAKPIRLESIYSVDARFPLITPGPACDVPKDVGVGNIIEVTCFLDASLLRREKYSIPLKIEFRRNESVTTPRHNITGEIFTTAH